MSNEAENRPPAEDMKQAEAATAPIPVPADDEIRRPRLQEDADMEQAGAAVAPIQIPENDEIRRPRLQEDADMEQAGAAVAPIQIPENDEIRRPRLQEDADMEQAGAAVAPIQIPENDEIRRRRLQRGTNDALEHSLGCHDRNCRTFACDQMKEVIAHILWCQDGFPGKCLACANFTAMTVAHTVFCRVEDCNVPYCKDWKDRVCAMRVNEHLANHGLLRKLRKPRRLRGH